MACLNEKTYLKELSSDNKQIFVPTFFGMIIFDSSLYNFVPTVEILRQYLDNADEILNDLIFSDPKVEILPLARVLNSLCFDEIFDELIFELPMRTYCLFPENFNFQNEGHWFVLMDIWKEMEHAHVNKLKMSGDVESNPGPVQSRPVNTQNNDPRVTRLENAIARRDLKIRTLLRQMQRAAKRPRAQGMFGDIKTFVRKAAEIPDSERIDGVASDINRITNFLDSMLPILQTNFAQTGLEITDKLVSIKDDLIKVIILVLLIKLFMRFKKYRSAVALVLLFVCQHYGMHHKIIELVRDLIAQIRKPTAQMETEEFIYSSAFQTCGKILFAVLAFICVKKIPGKQDWDTYLLRLDRLPKAQAGAQKIYDFTTEYWNLAHESIKMMVLGKSREELRAAAGIYTEIDEWASKIRKYLDLEERNKIDVDVVVAAEVEQLWKRGLEFKADKLLSREADKLVTTMLMPARSLFEYVSTSPIKGGGPRMKPVCVWLCGASGIGKTEMIYPLCIDVLREMGLKTADDYQHQVYARQVETEFWDGYKGQKIVIYDDAFQKKDDRVTANPEVFEVIRSCNTFPQHLHMAALQEKNTFSAAELMLYTTNEMQVEINSLTFPDAFKNRMYENAYVVTPKEQYRKYEPVEGRERAISLDLTKIDQNKAIDLSIYQFQKMNKNMEAVGEPIDYDDFAKMITMQWKAKKQQSMDKLKFLENYATRPVAQMETDEFVDCTFDFASDISTRITAGENLEAIEYSYSLNDSVFDAYREWKKTNVKINIWQNYIDRFNVVYASFKAKLASLKEETLKVLSEHPYLSLLGFVGIVISMFGLYQIFVSDDKVEEDHDVDYCFSCDPTNVLCRAEYKDVEFFGAKHCCNCRAKAEITASGDVRTIRQMRPKTELAASGDVRTQKTVRPKVESRPISEWDIQDQRNHVESLYSGSLVGNGVLRFMKKK
uniref:Putative ORF1 protein 1 n=1 Tax=Millport beadlet anemone dicistro-like virus 1 TaxID=2021917 RepID=A0A221LFC1_9VIRU|nr:putative ORF1 protein 1 [Millport beadlet anemone dicistro-like virus 1]